MTTEDIILLLRMSPAPLEAICSELEINYAKLRWMILSKNSRNYYTHFEIAKKSGGARAINAPTWRIKDAQRKFSRILSFLYSPKPAAHAYLEQRDITTNASRHVKKRFVLNIDLKDFFPSINFGRVRGALMSKPYELSETSATFIAQLCVLENCLPQGAPTSPVISNIICRKMDNDLQKIAKTHNCNYTRYADDITFSSTMRRFPLDLAIPTTKDGKVKVEVGKTIQDALASNGFIINPDKIRMQTYREKQVVTGLKVNQKLNLERDYLSKVRAILYSWEKFGLDAAQERYRQALQLSGAAPKIQAVLAGRLAYIRRIKGETNISYRKLANKYYELTGSTKRYSLNTEDEITSNLWILEIKGIDPKGVEFTAQQGTAFSIGPGTMVTCAHVVEYADTSNTIRVFQPDSTHLQYEATIESINSDIDLAIIRVAETIQRTQNYLKLKYLANIKRGDSLVVAGFPEYALGHEATITPSVVSGFRLKSTIRRIFVDTPIYHGASGGPVFDHRYHVIGVAVTGAISLAATKETAEYSIIPIDALKHLKSSNTHTHL